MLVWCLGLGVFFISWLLTWGLRSYALRISLLDIPNDRSSHVIPVPRGGGMAIVLSFTLALLSIYLLGWLSLSLFLALLLPGLVVAALGFLDDLYTLPARWRLLGHIIAATVAIYCLGGMPSLTLFGWLLPGGIIMGVLAVIYLIWLLNLYNFMDGIDGIAGVEAISVSLGGALLYWLSGNFSALALPVILAASVAGFLCWNLPRARIFMGDVGSGFLGIILGIMSIQAGAISAPLFWAWLVLLGVFIVDATVTLLRRAFQGDKIYEAHRSHAYQHASRRFNSHLLITLAVLSINIFWLLPLAVLVALGYVEGVIGLLVAYIPLVLLAVKFNAGKAG